MRLSLGVVLLLWALLYLLSYPTPIGDDLYFTGTAINLAQGKGYANPYCPLLDHWGARENFFVYVPLHAYVLAAWIKVFGISRWSFALFQCGAGAVASFALVVFFDCKKRKVLCAVVLSLLVAIILDASGLRPDDLGFALFLCGALILKVRSNWAWVLCSFSLFLTAICTPNFAILIPILVLSALYTRSELTYPLKRETLYRLAGTLAAGAVAFVLFLAMIHFQLGAFLAMFTAFNQSNSHHWVVAFSEHSVRYVLRVCVLSALAFAALFTARVRPELFDVRVTWGTILAFLAGTIGLSAVYMSSMNGSLWLESYLVLVFLWLILHWQGPNGHVYWAAGAVFVFMLVHHRERVIQTATVPFLAPRLHQPELRAQIEAAHADQVYIDPFALAAIYNYQIPAHTYDYFFGFKRVISSLKEVPPNSLLVLSPVYMENDLVPSAPALFGDVPVNMARDPYQFVLIKTPP